MEREKHPEAPELCILLPFTFAFKATTLTSLSRRGNFKTTAVSTGGMGKGKEKSCPMGMWLLWRNAGFPLPRGARGFTKKGHWDSEELP